MSVNGIQGRQFPEQRVQEIARPEVFSIKGKTGGSEAIVNKVKDIWHTIQSFFSTTATKRPEDIKLSQQPPPQTKEIPKVWTPSPKLLPERQLDTRMQQVTPERRIGRPDEPPRAFDNTNQFNAYLRQTGHSETEIKKAIDLNAMRLSEERDDRGESPLKAAVQAQNLPAVRYILNEKGQYLNDRENYQQHVMTAAVETQNLDILNAVLDSKVKTNSQNKAHFNNARVRAEQLAREAPAGSAEQKTAAQVHSRFG